MINAKQPWLIYLLISLALAAPESFAAAEEKLDEHVAHEHGRIIVNLILEGQSLVVELEAPAVHVLGFEHAPRSVTQKSKVAEINLWLESGKGLLNVPRDANCQLQSVNYTAPNFDRTTDHVDYKARVNYRCRNPLVLAWVELALLQRLIGVEITTVNLITSTLQKQLTLKERASRVPLR